jgi:hypothetical protein
MLQLPFLPCVMYRKPHLLFALDGSGYPSQSSSADLCCLGRSTVGRKSRISDCWPELQLRGSAGWEGRRGHGDLLNLYLWICMDGLYVC